MLRLTPSIWLFHHHTQVNFPVAAANFRFVGFIPSRWLYGIFICKSLCSLWNFVLHLYLFFKQPAGRWFFQKFSYLFQFYPYKFSFSWPRESVTFSLKTWFEIYPFVWNDYIYNLSVLYSGFSDRIHLSRISTFHCLFILDHFLAFHELYLQKHSEDAY